MRRDWLASVQVDVGAEPSGDLVFAPIDAAGDPGALNRYVLEHFGLDRSWLPDAAALKKGFEILNVSGRRLVFIVTVDTENTETLLSRNLARALSGCGPLAKLSIWIPLLGTGVGGLSFERSAELIANVFESTKIGREASLRIRVSCPPEISAEGATRVREIFGYLSEAEVRAALATALAGRNTSLLVQMILEEAMRVAGRRQESLFAVPNAVDVLFATVLHGERAERGDSARVFYELVAGGANAELFAKDRASYRFTGPTAARKRDDWDLGQLLDGAFELAERMSLTSKLHGRHLLAALIDWATFDRAVLARMTSWGVELTSLRRDLGMRLAMIQGEEEAWAEFAETGRSRSIDRFVATYDADVAARGEDRLKIADDVDAFACLIASTQLTPPLSVGLFGNWGSGKTFFMRRLRDRIDELSRDEDDSFRKRILQVEFNAWHYVDSNLWATLVSEIFDRLDERLQLEAGTRDADGGVKRLREELSKANGLFSEAKTSLEAARAAREKAEADLEEARRQQKTVQQRLSKSAEDIVAAIGRMPEAERLRRILKEELGIDVAGMSLKDLKEKLHEADAAYVQAWQAIRALFSTAGLGWRLLKLLFAVVLPPLLVAGFAAAVTKESYVEALQHSFEQKYGFLFGALLPLCKFRKSVSTGLRRVKEARHELDELEQQRKVDEDAKADALMAPFAKDVEDAETRVVAATKMVASIEAQLDELRPGRQLTKLVQERIANDAYRKHLGLVALIRQDLKRLSDYLMSHEEVPVDRIVLYIDDLDRCPPDRVVEVLQAAHLLLAFPLFVVIVGVDARWVSHALETEYPGLLSADNARDGAAGAKAAGAVDYLEKVFQVPFWLRAHADDPCRDLLSQLLGEDVAKDATTEENSSRPAGAVDAAPTTTTKQSPPAGSTKETAAPKELAPLPKDAVLRSVAPPATPPSTSSAPRHRQRLALLKIAKPELDFATGLSPWIGPSPRRTKRFVNLYRLIKATLIGSELEAYVRRDGFSGDHRAVLTLLALVTAAPSLADHAIAVFSQPSSTTLSSALLQLEERLAERADTEALAVLGILNHYADAHGRDRDVSALGRWAPRVARYSFRQHAVTARS